MADCEKCGTRPATKGNFCGICADVIYGGKPDYHKTWEEFLAEELNNKQNIKTLSRVDEELLVYQYYLWERRNGGKIHVDPTLHGPGGFTPEYQKLMKWFQDVFIHLLKHRWSRTDDGTTFNADEIAKEYGRFMASINGLLLDLTSSSKYGGMADGERVLMLIKKMLRLQKADVSLVDNVGAAFIPGSALFFMELFASFRDSKILGSFQQQVEGMEWADAEHLISQPMVLPIEWPHQVEALMAWERNDHTGIIEMATGTGKTLVGMMAITKLYEQESDGSVLVLGPSKAILNQWRREVVEKLGILDDWNSEYTRPVHADLFTIEFNTFQTAYKAPYLFHPDFLIVDEVHHGAAQAFRQALTIPASWKMGLSATVEGDSREYVLANELGPVVYNFPLAEAISRNVLPCFEWKLHPTYLAIKEDEEFSKLSDRINKVFRVVKLDAATAKKISGKIVLEDLHDFTRLLEIARYHHIDLPDDWKELQLLILRRRWIIHKSKPKLERATELARCYAATNKVVMFAMDTESCDLIAGRLRKEFDNIFVAHSKSDVDPSEEIFKFKKAKNGVLIGAKMLDEGIDIPDADIGISVSSSKTKLQLVQRMGRILRKKPGKKPVFHHYLAVPDAGRRVMEEDDLVYLDDLSWMQETALKLGMEAELVDEESELQQTRMRAEALLGKRMSEKRETSLPSYGSLNIGSVISLLPDEMRLRLAGQLSGFGPGTIMSDLQWAGQLRLAFGKREGEPVIWPGNWYVLIAGNRDPRRIASLLR